MSIGAIFSAAGVAAGAAVGGAFVKAVTDRAADAVVNSSLNKVVGALHAAWASGAGQNYVSKTKSVRVEPYALVDSRAARLPITKDVMNVAQRLFTSYYLLSVATDNTIEGVKVSKYLDKFSPDRDLNAATLSFLSTESYQLGLPFVGEAAGLDRYSEYTTEANDPRGRNETGLKGSPLTDESHPSGGASFAATTAKVVNDIGNLAVGQIVDVTIQKDNNRATVPVSVRLRVLGMEPVTLSEMLALGGTNSTPSARFRQWRMGEKELFRDLVFNMDQIDAYRRASFADKSGYFRKAHARANKGLIATLLTGQPSIGDASSICVITKDTQIEAEGRMNGRFSDYATRQGMFDGGLMMLLLVIDPDHETVTIYTRDIEDFGVYTIKDIKGASPTAANGDLSEIMKSYLEGRVPGRL